MHEPIRKCVQARTCHACGVALHALVDTSGFQIRQVEVLVREARRLTTENNHLHTKLVAAADKLDRFERTTQQVHRRLEQRASEAVQEKQAALTKCRALQRDKHDLPHQLTNGARHAG